MIKGRYILFPGTRYACILPNTVVNEGELAFMKMLLQGDTSVVAPGGNFYMGMCGEGNGETATLTSLVGEPLISSGYARQAVARNASGWPLVDSVGGSARGRSAVVTFSAPTSDYDKTFTRFFLCSVASGTAGTLFSFSAPLPAPYQMRLGNSFPVQYELYLE